MSALELGKFSIGVGDRFAHQAKAQLQACLEAAQAGVEVIPVWNKSNREHNIIGSEPSQTRAAADAAVKALHWKKPYFCDADHINTDHRRSFPRVLRLLHHRRRRRDRQAGRFLIHRAVCEAPLRSDRAKFNSMESTSPSKSPPRCFAPQPLKFLFAVEECRQSLPQD
jgi:hypothetical protein